MQQNRIMNIDPTKRNHSPVDFLPNSKIYNLQSCFLPYWNSAPKGKLRILGKSICFVQTLKEPWLLNLEASIFLHGKVEALHLSLPYRAPWKCTPGRR